MYGRKISKFIFAYKLENKFRELAIFSIHPPQCSAQLINMTAITSCLSISFQVV